jgi:hypothetical protein
MLLLLLAVAGITTAIASSEPVHPDVSKRNLLFARVPRPATPSPTPDTYAPTHAPTFRPAPFSIYITCDCGCDLYVNGNKVEYDDSQVNTLHFFPTVKPGDVIAINGISDGRESGFVGVFGGKVTKASEWKCSTEESPGWNTNNFDDSLWSNAVSYGTEDGTEEASYVWVHPDWHNPNIPGDAEWFWTMNYWIDDRVYCRYFPDVDPSEDYYY